MRASQHAIRLLVPIALVLSTVPAEAAGRVESHTYGATPATFGCAGIEGAESQGFAICLGSVIADLDGSDNALTVSIADATGEAVHGSYRFYRVETGPEGLEWRVTISEGVFCGSVTDVPVPSTATGLRIGLGSVQSACAAPATAGTVTLTFA